MTDVLAVPRDRAPSGRLLSLEAALGERRAVHVVLRDRRWAVVRCGDEQPLSLHDRKDDAIVAARQAAADAADVVVFDLGGRPMEPPAGAKRSA